MSHRQRSYRLQVVADADSGFLARVCGTLTSLSLVPESFHSRRGGGTGEQIILVVILIEAAARQVDLLERKLRQMTQVHGTRCGLATFFGRDIEQD